ncbi:MAG: trypsin-like peptidase domain-containing protein [Clostridiales bacterium]|nr:trypsin-like peptidase domain-containing protein [Clostridiales bacterium]
MRGNTGAYGNGEPQRNSQAKEKAPHGGFGGRKMVALALCCALVGGVVGAGGANLLSGGSSSTTILSGSRSSTATAVTLSTVDTSEALTAAEVYAQNVNATVGITTTTSTNYFGYETTSAASGSGFILTSDGYVFTNYHVIEDSDEITVSTYDGTSYEATLIGYDEDSDVAVLKIEATDLTPVVLGDSDELSVGDEVAAIGNPLGELTFSLTTGVVSALNRAVTLSTNVTMNLIQTDCAINSGNSGGALFNMYGEVIGITNAKYSGSSTSSSASVDNIGFAIPINQVKNIITSIIEDGTVEKSYIGVSVSSMTTDAAASSGLSSGAVVQSVTEGSPAEDAGLEAGDIITKAGDTEISSSSDLVLAVQKLSDGDELVLTVYRDGEEMEITVTVGTQTSSALPDTDDEDSASDSSDPYGSFGSGSDSYGSFGEGSDGYGSYGDGSDSFGGYGNYGGYGDSDGNSGDSDDSSDNDSAEGSML